jgi:hypothetical protein
VVFINRVLLQTFIKDVVVVLKLRALLLKLRAVLCLLSEQTTEGFLDLTADRLVPGPRDLLVGVAAIFSNRSGNWFER